jgi:hypothetical protein
MAPWANKKPDRLAMGWGDVILLSRAIEGQATAVAQEAGQGQSGNPNDECAFALSRQPAGSNPWGDGQKT